MAKTAPERLAKKLQPAIHLTELLAHPVRLQIILELAKGDECAAGWLVSKLNIEFSIVSKHLAILKREDIVETVRESQWIYYRLKSPCIMDFIDGLIELSDKLTTR